jgi:4a-hydroxytetrahydrobiopterin dehydratase
MATERCIPCSSDLPPLDKEKCEMYLADLPAWQLDEDAKSVFRKFSFKNFALALKFADQVGELAEEMGHHPVLTVGWGFCRVRFKTAKIGGLHTNDFIMAAHVDELLKE